MNKCLFGLILLAHVFGAGMVFAAAETEAGAAVVQSDKYTITQHVYRQSVSHDKPNSATFDQQYFVLTPVTASKLSPVFFVLGNETDTTHEKLAQLYSAYGEPEDMIFISSEHRGYGQSITDGDQSKPDYVTIDAALKDYQLLIQDLKQNYTGPWVVAGYSYGGALAIQFGHDFPDLAQVILSSSAPIEWPFEIPAYAEQARQNLGERFSGRLHRHLARLSHADATPGQRYAKELLVGVTAGLSQIEAFQSFKPYISLLSYLPTSVLMSVLDLLMPEDAYAWADARRLKQLSHEQAKTGRFNWYTWKYQQCTEVGTFYGADLFHYSTQHHVEDCKATFGERPAYQHAAKWEVATMLRNTAISTVVVSGGQDPWMQLGVRPGHDFSNIEFIYKASGFHCPDRDDPVFGQQVLERLRAYF